MDENHCKSYFNLYLEGIHTSTNMHCQKLDLTRIPIHLYSAEEKPTQADYQYNLGVNDKGEELCDYNYVRAEHCTLWHITVCI